MLHLLNLPARLTLHAGRMKGEPGINSQSLRAIPIWPAGYRSYWSLCRWHSALLGLDHATKSSLQYGYPDADIPIVQMSIDEAQPASFHFDYSNCKLSFNCEQNATLTMSLTCARSARPLRHARR